MSIKDIFDIRTDERVPQRLHGEPLDAVSTGREDRRRLGRGKVDEWEGWRRMMRHLVGRGVERFAHSRGWERLEKRARRFADKANSPR